LEQFKQEFPARFLVRFHMTVLLLGVCASGLLVSKVLLELGLRSMLVRYLIAVCVSYLVFFFLMRVWLWYVGASSKHDRAHLDLNVGGGLDLGQMPVNAVPGGAGIDDIADGGLSGAGGEFGGGGATDIWGDASTVSASGHSSVASSGRGDSGRSSGWSFDPGDEAMVLIALALLLLAIFGAGAYLVYAAPEILSEAAFQALLAAGLIKASRKISRQGWMGSVLRATCVPFLVVLLMTGVFGWVAQQHYPHAARLSDIFKHPSSEKR
jgi:hypothetical protein